MFLKSVKTILQHLKKYFHSVVLFASVFRETSIDGVEEQVQFQLPTTHKY